MGNELALAFHCESKATNANAKNVSKHKKMSAFELAFACYTNTSSREQIPSQRLWEAGEFDHQLEQRVARLMVLMMLTKLLLTNEYSRSQTKERAFRQL
jgi:hypothetical protein